jgi:hypothetical protein
MLSFDPSGVQFAWDSTSISLAQTCLRKYQYKMLEGWQSASLSVHLRFGQHYASALEHFYKRTALGEDFEDALRGIVEEVLEATWDRPKCEVCNGAGKLPLTAEEAAKRIGGVTAASVDSAYEDCTACECTGFALTGGAPWDSLHNLKTRENLVRTIIWYIDHFEEDPAPVVILSDGAPAVEHSFALPVDDGLIFSGHIDRLVTYQSHVFVMDQKTTTSTLSPYYFDQFKPNVQMSMYSFAGKIIYGSPIKGIIIDAAQIAVGFSKFARDMTFRTEEELTEWYDSSMYWIEQARHATRENYFPMNPASCGNYGGCEFRKICSKSPEFRKPFLEGNFEKGERWDPLKVR